MGIIGNIFVKLGLDNSAYKKGLNESQQKTSAFANSLEKVKGMMAAAFSVSAIIGFAKKSIQAFAEQEMAVAKLEAALKATNGAAGITSTEIQNLASSLQKVTLYGDEATIAAAQMLTKFKSIKGEIFKEAIKSAQDLATAMDMDLNSAIQQIGRALENPQQGLMLMRRNGVMFTEEVTAKIMRLVNEGKLYEAQLLVLQGLNDRFGGSAKAAADTAIGSWKLLGNAINDTMEIIGSAITPTKGLVFALSGFVGVINDIVGLTKGLSFIDKIGLLTGNVNSWKKTGEELKKINDETARGAIIAKNYTTNLKGVADAEARILSIQSSNIPNYIKEEAIKLLRIYIGENTKEASVTKGLIGTLEDEIAAKQELLNLETNPKNIRALNDEIALLNRKLGILKMTSEEYANYNQYRTNPLPKVTSGAGIQGSIVTNADDPITSSQKNTAQLISSNKEALDDFGMTLSDWESLGQQFNSVIQNSMISSFDALADALGDLSNINGASILAALLSPFADFAISLGTIILTSGTAIESLKAAIINMFGAGPHAAVLAGAALIAIGVGAKVGIAALSKSGSSGSSSQSTGSPTSYSGGYSVAGVSNEPLKVQVYGVLSGQDIVISSERTNVNRNR